MAPASAKNRSLGLLWGPALRYLRRVEASFESRHVPFVAAMIEEARLDIVIGEMALLHELYL